MLKTSKRALKAKKKLEKQADERTHGIKKRSVSPRLLQKIRKEAKTLGLSTEEYLRLVVGVSASLRQGLAEDQGVDGKQLLQWAENPMFLALIQWISKYAVSAMQGNEETAEEQSKSSAAHSPGLTMPNRPQTPFVPSPLNVPHVPQVAYPNLTDPNLANPQFKQTAPQNRLSQSRPGTSQSQHVVSPLHFPNWF